MGIEAWRGTDSDPVTSHGFRQPILNQISRTRSFLHSAMDIPFHWHREMEILFVLRGSVQIVLEGQICHLETDDVMIINANVPHNSLSIAPDTLICGLHIDTAHYQSMGIAEFANRAYKCKSFLHDKSFQEKLRPVKAFMARILLDDRKNPNNSAIQFSMVIALCSYIAATFSFDARPSHSSGADRSGPLRIRRIMEAIGMGEDVASLTDLARKEGITLSHLSRLFKKQTGMHFRDYLQNTRLDHVAWDILHRKGPIADIMRERNIGNPAQFYHRFKDRFGCSPATFRRTIPLAPTGGLAILDIKDEAMGLLTRHLQDIAPGINQTVSPNPRFNQTHLDVVTFHQF
ncbi:DNA-binding transcriptional activator FeaR [Agrobacterium sp. DSM 25558]|uniref:AraC family transcriptional regulator n=1 Tax=Agrobacterium sp. DSM 25558 TaxID=1907665 RepID=UPI00097242C0|nr:AraC family transcriptional regulator [Agrobacterium sp. DSM 25558]SCX23090.1 DNA-binding transcriptional activator FeaR [Agrobacterium sp. DSM 25558]